MKTHEVSCLDIDVVHVVEDLQVAIAVVHHSYDREPPCEDVVGHVDALVRVLLQVPVSGPVMQARMWNDLLDNDQTGQILTAWIAKEELRALLASRTGGWRHDVAHRLHRFNLWCAGSDIPELHRLASTIRAWWPEVLGYLQIGHTNAARCGPGSHRSRSHS